MSEEPRQPDWIPRAWEIEVPGKPLIYDPELNIRHALDMHIKALREKDCARRRAQRRRREIYVHRSGWGGKRPGAGRPRKT
jgi:hypothetical protein